jgi:hypothetical protein
VLATKKFTFARAFFIGKSNLIFAQHWLVDEDITPIDTNNTPQVDIQGPITRARAQQLNL